jgi:ribonuclease-3
VRSHFNLKRNDLLPENIPKAEFSIRIAQGGALLEKGGSMSDSRGMDHVEAPADFARRLGLPFKNQLMLRRALTHRSFLNENADALEDNERLEFLGDAVLDFLVADWLYNRYPEMAEGKLTRLRSAMVGTPQLAAFAREIDLGNALLLGKGEDEGGGRKRKTILCAGFEAVVGALYLDSGIEAVRSFVLPMMIPETEKILSNHQDRDPKSLLQEWAQSRHLGVPIYKEVSCTGPDHDRTYVFEVYIDGERLGRGEGSNKRDASKKAAFDAQARLGL